MPLPEVIKPKTVRYHLSVKSCSICGETFPPNSSIQKYCYDCLFYGNSVMKSLNNVHRKMLDRCHNPNARDYKWYGARGISVCELWRADRQAFNAWARMNGFQIGLHLDRRDTDGDYSPDNCRFVTPKVNLNNRRNKATFENGTRRCYLCRQVKPLSGFHKSGLGRHYECRPCRNALRRKA